MDFVGTTLSAVTIPMALLTVGSVAGGVYLLGTGAHGIVLGGIVAGLLCWLFAWGLEWAVARVDELAWIERRRSHILLSKVTAIASAGLPLLIILGWEYAVFSVVMAADGPHLALWLWAYGIACAPWSIFALQTSSDRRTLCGIRAYAGHLSFWLLTATWLTLPDAGWLAFACMIPPVGLPFVTGLLLATADRETLRNVRI